MILFASDYDGTLHFRDERIRPADLKAIQTFVSEGNIFAIATGRSYESLQASAREYCLPADYCICANGSAVFKDGNAILRNTLPEENIIEILKCADSCRITLFEFGNGRESFEYEADPAQDLQRQIQEACNIHFKDPCGMWPDGIVQIGYACPDKHVLNRCLATLEQIPGICAHVNSVFIDITSAKSSKENAVAFTAEITGADSICAAGDDWNDLGMLKKYDGFLLNSAAPELKQFCSRTADSVADCLKLICR